MARVLVMDDDRSSRFAIAATLRQAGYDMVEAANGLEALQLLIDDPNFAAILSDVQVAPLDGLRLLNEVHRHYPTIPVIIASGRAEQAVQAQQQRAAGCLTKPFSRQQLVKSVTTATG